MLAMRPTERNEPDAIRYVLSQQVSNKRPWFADFFGCHLCVVRGIDDDAQQRLRTICAEEAHGLFKPEEELLQIVGGPGV